MNALRDDARRNHDALFPNQVSTLQQTDPELIELFDNWAFGELLEDPTLDVRTRLLVQLAAMIACGATSEYRVMLGAALGVGVTPVEVKELVYQAVPYVGMARVFDFLHVTNALLTELGVALPLPPQSTTTPETRFERGLAVQRRALGAATVARLSTESPADQLHLQRHLSANCFGDYLTRTGLELKVRELLTLSMLASLGGCEPQLAGHVAANLAVGNDRAVLISAVTHLLPFIGYPRALNALRVITQGTAS